MQPLLRLDRPPPVSSTSQIHSNPSPTSTHSSSTCSSMFDSSSSDLLSARRMSEPPLDGDRRMSQGSTSSWSSNGDSTYRKNGQPSSQPLQGISSSDSVATSSPHEVTTPDSDHFSNYFISRNGNTSPASSATSTAPSKGGVTPRQEAPPPVWPIHHPPNGNLGEGMEINDGHWQETLKSEGTVRRKFTR